MMIYEEKQTLLKETKERLINEVGNSPLGQSLREELVDLMSDLSDVRNIPDEIVMGEQSRLVAEVIGRREASKQLLKFYKRLIPQEKKTIKKIYK
jgi:hypothetical protein